MNDEFHLKYRPSSWDEMIGQSATIRSLKSVLRKGNARTFLFTGPSGVGKTTLARLIAHQVGCSGENILEIDGATNTGIDDMRKVADRLQYASIDGTPRCVIVDEVHAVSKQSFQSLLKILEEPPEGVYWVLCTTEADRVPAQIKTRCAAYNLKKVDDEEIGELLSRVKSAEKLTNLKDEALEAIVEASDGSPRQALVFLAQCAGLKKMSSIRLVLEQQQDSAETVELCRSLLSVASGSKVPWKKITALLNSLDVPAETVRIIVLRYMNSVMLKAPPPKAGAALSVMEQFESPFLDREGFAPLTLACARVWNGGD